MEAVKVEPGLVIGEPHRIWRAARALNVEVHEHGDAAEHGAGNEGQAQDAFRALRILQVLVDHSTVRHGVSQRNEINRDIVLSYVLAYLPPLDGNLLPHTCVYLHDSLSN